MKRGFTLTELLLVITIIGIMAGLALSALSGATEMAREARTRSIIAKIDQLIMDQYEGYRTRAVPVRVPPNTNSRDAARFRLYALRDLMRMEMPERITDLSDGPASITIGPTTLTMSVPSALQSYRRSATRACGTSWATVWTDQHQGAECLYLIISRMHDGDKNALDFFLADEVGDTDGDGMKEILDGWGNPIEFLRWAPGYTIQNSAITTVTSRYTTSTLPPPDSRLVRSCETPDNFDPLHADPRWLFSGTANPACFLLRPLILSGGRDKKIDAAMKGVDGSGNAFRFSIQSPPNDPYFMPTVSGQYQFGTPVDFDGDGLSVDDITNHDPRTP